MVTIDLPLALKPPVLPSNGADIRTSTEWQRAGGGKGKGKDAAKRHASDTGAPAVVLWKSGNVTIYTEDRDGSDEVRIRYH
jgi:hypothetical protein